MRAYMAFSIAEGSEEGAALVFANTAREARKLSYGCISCWNVDDWLDAGIRWIRDKSIFALGNQEKINSGTPHVIDSPEACDSCHLWGWGVTIDGKCTDCGGFAGERLMKLYQSLDFLSHV